MLFWQFSNIFIYVKIVGKIPDQLLNLWLFSNPQDKVQILVESMGQICPVVLHLFWTLSPRFGNTQTFKYWFSIFPTILTYDYVGKLPEQHFSVWLFLNPGNKILFLLKFIEARISEWSVYDQMQRRGWFDPQVVLPHLEAFLYFDCIGHIILLCSRSANKQKMIYH